MKLIDTHSHIYTQEFESDLHEVILRARQAGIKKILMPNIDLDSIEDMHRLCIEFPEICYPMMGLHPTSVKQNYKQHLSFIRTFFSQYKYVAVGEIGLDLYWDKTFLKEQMDAFETQLQWSLELQIPVVIHNRDAFPQVLECLKRVGINQLKGVFHSFGGTQEDLDSILAYENFMIGINGVVTFKNSRLDEVIKHCPLDRIVVETDAPYLSPVPFRGKRNEPAYILKTVEKLAIIFDTTPEEIGRITSENASKLFQI